MLLDYNPLPSKNMQKKMDYFFNPYEKEKRGYFKFYGNGLYKETSMQKGWSRVNDFIYKPNDKSQTKKVLELMWKQKD